MELYAIVLIVFASVALLSGVKNLEAATAVYSFVKELREGVNTWFSFIMLVIELFKESIKYIIAAILIAVPSVLFWLSAILRPERWKSLLLITLGGIILPALSIEAANNLPKDTHQIVQITLLSFAHLYLCTGVVQLCFAERHQNFWWTDRLEYQSQQVVDLRKVTALDAMKSLSESDWDFRNYTRRLRQAEDHKDSKATFELLACALMPEGYEKGQDYGFLREARRIHEAFCAAEKPDPNVLEGVRFWNQPKPIYNDPVVDALRWLWYGIKGGCYMALCEMEVVVERIKERCSNASNVNYTAEMVCPGIALSTVKTTLPLPQSNWPAHVVPNCAGLLKELPKRSAPQTRMFFKNQTRKSRKLLRAVEQSKAENR